MPKTSAYEVAIGINQVKITNPEKVFWPGQGFTKGDMINYYSQLAPYLLPHLQSRPLVLVRYPHGTEGEYFYQKSCPAYAPGFVNIAPVPHGPDKTINYILGNNMETLIWIANQGAIEIHPWYSRWPTVDYPDVAVFDLDPADGATFDDVLEIALLIKQALASFGLEVYPKTSGATGLHLFLPLAPGHTYAQVVAATEFIARLVVSVYPAKATVERTVKKRDGKVYVDYLQNGRGKTVAAVYSLRPLPGAPVSTPVTWEEIKASSFRPADFNLVTIMKELPERSKHFAPVLSGGQNLQPLLNQLSRQGG